MAELKFIQKPFVRMTAWYGFLVIYSALSFIDKDGKRHLIKSFPLGTPEKERKGSMHGYLRYDVENSKKEMQAMKTALQDNGYRWLDLYMKWPYHPEETKGNDPLQMIQWIRKKGYHFVDFTDIHIHDSHADFNGNLQEYSAAFFYRIYDMDLVEEIRRAAPEVKITDYRAQS